MLFLPEAKTYNAECDSIPTGLSLKQKPNMTCLQNFGEVDLKYAYLYKQSPKR
jgi:hypothetical protein